MTGRSRKKGVTLLSRRMLSSRASRIISTVPDFPAVSDCVISESQTMTSHMWDMSIQIGRQISGWFQAGTGRLEVALQLSPFLSK